jgi:2-oxoglutarate dehydrogenase E1 component
VSAETKWGIQSGIVVVLPHGMDGQGPEHSQARIERVLDLSDDICDEDQSSTYQDQMRTCNIQVINCTNGANYFHALRRQVHREYRKPLFSFNSKKILKYKPVINFLFRPINFSNK